MASDDSAYYRQRADDEHALAKTTQNEKVAKIHEEFAREYKALVEQSRPRPTPSDYALHVDLPEQSRWHSDWKGLIRTRRIGENDR